MGREAVFISYSHDSPEHSDRVLALANALIGKGLHVELDQYIDSPEHGWPSWCEEQLRSDKAKYVLVICTPAYHDGVMNRVAFDKRRGVYWEGALIHQYIYDEKGNKRFIPVLIDKAPDDSVPLPLRPFTRCRLEAFDLNDPGFQALYRRLTGRPAIIRPEPGQLVDLAPRNYPASKGVASRPAVRDSRPLPSKDTPHSQDVLGVPVDSGRVDSATANRKVNAVDHRRDHPRGDTLAANDGANAGTASTRPTKVFLTHSTTVYAVYGVVSL